MSICLPCNKLETCIHAFCPYSLQSYSPRRTQNSSKWAHRIDEENKTVVERKYSERMEMPTSSSLKLSSATSLPAGWRVVLLASGSSSLRPEHTLEWPKEWVPCIPGIIWKAIISTSQAGSLSKGLIVSWMLLLSLSLCSLDCIERCVQKCVVLWMSWFDQHN